MPATFPPVDRRRWSAIDRDVPGNTAEKIWQKPIHMAWPRLMASIFQVRMVLEGASGPAASDLALAASTIHITIPPISSDHADDGNAFQVLADGLGQQERGDCSHDKGDEHKAERMSQDRTIALFASRKGGKKLRDAAAKIHRQTQNRAQFNDDGIHLPIAVRQADMKQGLGDSQVGRGAYRQKFGEAFDDAQNYG